MGKKSKAKSRYHKWLYQGANREHIFHHSKGKTFFQHFASLLGSVYVPSDCQWITLHNHVYKKLKRHNVHLTMDRGRLRLMYGTCAYSMMDLEFDNHIAETVAKVMERKLTVQEMALLIKIILDTSESKRLIGKMKYNTKKNILDYEFTEAMEEPVKVAGKDHWWFQDFMGDKFK